MGKVLVGAELVGAELVATVLTGGGSVPGWSACAGLETSELSPRAPRGAALPWVVYVVPSAQVGVRSGSAGVGSCQVGFRERRGRFRKEAR